MIDYDNVLKIAKEVQPKMIIAGASAYPRSIDFTKFREIADEVGAYLVVDMAHIAGLVAAGVHENPVGKAHVVTTTTHKTLRGPRGGLILWDDKTILMNKAVFPGTQGGPLEHIIAAKAVCFKEAATEEFKTYQKNVVANAAQLAASFKDNGFSLVSDGTDNHLMLLDLSETETTGKQLEEGLGKVAITVNKNTVPKEKRSPFITSGVRVGTPAVTSRGLKTDDMVQIANWFKETFDNLEDEAKLTSIRGQVMEMAKSFPLYPEWI